MHSARLRIRSGMLAGIAPVLLLTASFAAAAAAPQNLATFAPPQPARDFPAGTADAAPSAASMADIASSIREIVTGRQFEHMMSRKSDRDAIVAFYRARDFQPMWIADSAPSARASVASIRTTIRCRSSMPAAPWRRP
jgi:hypothetical protein